MKLLLLVVALAQVALSGHVAVRMPFLNPAGITYASYGLPSGHAAYNYDYSEQGLGYGNSAQLAYAAQSHAPVAYTAQAQYGHLAVAKAPVAVGYAQVPVKATVAVPTVHHVPAVADVPVTKYEAQPAVIQKIVDVAQPAIKTRKYEVRRPAIQKQFYDIEERTIVRPVGSALVELDEPLSKAQKGPSIVSTADGHQEAVYDDHVHVGHSLGHAVAVTAAPHAVAITPAAHTLAITPTAHTVAITPVSHHLHHEQAAYIQSPYLHKSPIAVPVAHHHHEHIAVSTTPSPLYLSTPESILVSSTPSPIYSDDSIAVEAAAARNAAEYAAYEAQYAHEEAVARAQIHNSNLAVEAYSNGAALEHQVAQAHHIVPAQQQVIAAHDAVRNINHLSHEEAQDNQQKLIKLLTARGGVAEVGFGRAGYAGEHIGDAGISRARVLSATPSPHHEAVEEKVKTRRIVVSKPVQTLQEIDVVEPATKIEQVAINTPTLVKTARLGVERVHTSVPVYGKALAPAIAHAQVPVGYYQH